MAAGAEFMRRTVGIVAAVLTVAAGASACGVFADGPASPGATPGGPSPVVMGGGHWVGRDGVTFTLGLPAPWEDHSHEYLAQNPTSVLAALWIAEGVLDDLTTFASASASFIGLEERPRAEVEEDLAGYESGMADAVRGDSGFIETAAGGAGYWGVVTGDVHGERRTMVSVHVAHGPYELFVLMETDRGPDDSALGALLDAITSVEFDGPLAIADRHGRPPNLDGRWTSYCAGVSADVQAEWVYIFDPAMDSTPWRCPESVDYLGSWSVTNDSGSFEVYVRLRVGASIGEARERVSAHGEPGTTNETPNGYLIRVVSEERVELEGGLTATGLRVVTTTPSGFDSHSVSYFVDLGPAGTVEVHVSDENNAADVDAAWLEPFLATLEPAEF